MMRIIEKVAIAAILVGTAAGASAKGVREDLSKEAKISEADARKTAVARVPGTVQLEKLEREHKRVVYSYDIKQSNKSGVEEVLVDAKNGKIVSVKHETAAQEKRERGGK